MLLLAVFVKDMKSLGKEYGVQLKVRKKREAVLKKSDPKEELKVETKSAKVETPVASTYGDGVSPLKSRSPNPTCALTKRSPPQSLLASETPTSSPHGFVSISKVDEKEENGHNEREELEEEVRAGRRAGWRSGAKRQQKHYTAFLHNDGILERSDNSIPIRLFKKSSSTLRSQPFSSSLRIYYPPS